MTLKTMNNNNITIIFLLTTILISSLYNWKT
jgi:hypothetical protein